jgi:uncharacterized protein (TIRG00374 family)
VNRRLQLLLGIVVSIACLWWAMREVRLIEVWLALKRADYRGFVAVIAFTLIGFWLRAWRWRWLLTAPRPIPLGSLYSATMIGFMANNLLPFRLGEFVRAWALGRRESLSKTNVFASVVVERAIDMLTLLAIFGITLLLHPIAPDTEAGRLTNAGATTLLVICVGLTAFLVVLERSPRLMAALVDRAARWAPERVRHRAVAALQHFIDGLGLFRDVPRLLWVFVLSFVMFGAFALGLQVSMAALHIPVPWYGGLVMLVITAIGIMVPAAPGYIGTLNIACVAGLALFGVEKDLANAFSWFYWAGQWLPVTIVGLYCLRREGIELATLGHLDESAA